MAGFSLSILGLILTTLLFDGCRRVDDPGADSRPRAPITINERNLEWKKSLIALDDRLAILEARCRHAGEIPVSELRTAFFDARLEYKRKEFLWESAFPILARRVNGPAVDEVEKDCEHTVLPAQGFQVIEVILFASRKVERTDADSLRAWVSQMRQFLHEDELGAVSWSDSAVMEAMRLELFRLASMGLTGFDSPLALHSLEETRAALSGMDSILIHWFSLPDQNLGSWNSALAAAYKEIDSAKSFDEFDRAHFLTRNLDSIYRALIEIREKSGLSAPDGDFAYSPTAIGLFSTQAWNPYFFAPPFARQPASALISLGHKLFFDITLSANGERSCATCHRPGLGFADGLAKSATLDGNGRLSRHTPTLFYAAFQNNLFWDGRAESLEDQADAVVHNPKEMGGSLQKVATAMQNDTSYVEGFLSAFPNEIEDRDNLATPLRIRRALAAYIRSLANFNSPWDRFMEGDSNALSADAKRGFNLFMGKAKCATCHFPPLFNGALPPSYAETELEVLGVPATMNPPTLDQDSGRIVIDHAAVSLRAFKTPTVRNVVYTAPYMHNGVFLTLEAVVDFYDVGGGFGLGFNISNQTLATDSLKLSATEKQNLIDFLKSLSDSL